MPKRILVFAAHPDDEVLGCGGAIARFAHENAEIHIVFFTNGVDARKSSAITSHLDETIIARRNAATLAGKILGAKTVSFGDYPDNRMDTIPLLDIVQFVEEKISIHKPEMVFTHHAGDLNIDHCLVHKAVITACRPQPFFCVKTLLFFEIPSSTEWQPSKKKVFFPNWFIDISDVVSIKMQALEVYAEEIREWPHSRSYRAIQSLFSWRGASVGIDAAEAFMLGRFISKEKNAGSH